MRIIVLRHAERERGDPASEEFREKHFPLSAAGVKQAEALGGELTRRGFRPSAYFTSCFLHAKQTGQILRDTAKGDPSAGVIELCTLTPHFQGPREFRTKPQQWSGTEILRAVVRESKLAGYDLDQLDTVVLIMHKPRLERLLAGMTSRDQSQFRDIEYAGGVALKPSDLALLLQGAGEEDGRFSATLGA
jgi:phosphohistidine phosphatase SixA